MFNNIFINLVMYEYMFDITRMLCTKYFHYIFFFSFLELRLMIHILKI